MPEDDQFQVVKEKLISILEMDGNIVFPQKESKGDLFIGSNMSEEISRQIKMSDVVVADISKPSAYTSYEFGFARALSKPIVLLLSTSSEGKPHFDISSFQVITYDP